LNRARVKRSSRSGNYLNAVNELLQLSLIPEPFIAQPIGLEKVVNGLFKREPAFVLKGNSERIRASFLNVRDSTSGVLKFSEADLNVLFVDDDGVHRPRLIASEHRFRQDTSCIHYWI